MSFSARGRATVDRLNARFGGGSLVTLTRDSTVQNASTGEPLETLDVAAAASLGATTIDLDAPELRGTLVAGATFTIPSIDAQVYTVAADVIAASDRLAGVTFTPGLTGAAADNLGVTLTSASATYTVPCTLLDFQDREVDGDTIQTGDRKLLVSATGLAITPDEADAVTVGGVRYKVVRVLRKDPTASDAIAHVLHLRGGRAAA